MSVSTGDFDYVRELLHRRTGIALEPDKAYLVDSRLLPVARAHGMSDVSTLVQHLRGVPGGPVVDDSLDALSTNETSWLRDGEPFQVIVRDVLPQLMKLRNDTRSLTFWSAACSTGQEPYSLAMMVEDLLVGSGWTYRVAATDISGAALRRAEEGLYRQLEINRGLPASMLVRHFTHEGTGWRVSDDLRRRITFTRSNLVEDPPPVARADVVLMRNVLIYFDVPTRQRVLERVRKVLAPGGVLLLGAAETTLGLSEGWLRTTHGRTTINRLGEPPQTGVRNHSSVQVALTEIGQR
ncbi:MAG: CheR family methyltransferase [Actinomycetes bacterium]